MDDDLAEYQNFRNRHDSENDFSSESESEEPGGYESPNEDLQPNVMGSSLQPTRTLPPKPFGQIPSSMSFEQDAYEEIPQGFLKDFSPQDANERSSFTQTIGTQNLSSSSGKHIRPTGGLSVFPIQLPSQSGTRQPLPFSPVQNNPRQRNLNAGFPAPASFNPIANFQKTSSLISPTIPNVRPFQTIPHQSTSKTQESQKSLHLQPQLINIGAPSSTSPSIHQLNPVNKSVSKPTISAFPKQQPHKFPFLKEPSPMIRPISQDSTKPVRQWNIQQSVSSSVVPGTVRPNHSVSQPDSPEPVRQWNLQQSVPPSVVPGTVRPDHPISRSDSPKSLRSWNLQQSFPAPVGSGTVRLGHSVSQPDSPKPIRQWNLQPTIVPSAVSNTIKSDHPISHPDSSKPVRSWSPQQSIPSQEVSTTVKLDHPVSNQNTLKKKFQNFETLSKPSPPTVPKPKTNIRDFPIPSSAPPLPTKTSVEESFAKGETLTLNNGQVIPMTDLYRSLLQEKYFHPISKGSSGTYLPDGTFLLRPSTRHTDEKPLTLCLRHIGKVYVFSVEKRKNGLYSIGTEKEGEMQFTTVQEMISYYHDNPFYFEGMEAFFIHPGTEPP